ncbi:MAG: glycosyltransferase, partial [Alphaproteobacteria bacterium]|nr:glycosyltransferase [Alphaproteobacteria bacterium]
MAADLEYNVLCVSTDKRPGGIHHMMMVYEKSLAELGCQVTSMGYKWVQAMQAPPPNNVRRVFLGMFWRLAFLFNPFFRHYIKRLIDEADIVLCHNVSPIKKMIRTSRKTPIVLIDHSHKVRPDLNVDFIIALTDAARAQIIKTHPRFATSPNRVLLVPNGILNALPQKTKRDFRPPLRLGSLGRFVEKKGFDILIDLLACKGQESTLLTIYGEGEARAALEKRAVQKGVAERVSLPGWTENKAQFFDEIDILCVPSREEPFGLVLLESMAAGVPIITTPTAGSEMIIRDGENGLLVPCDNAPAFGEAIEKLRDKPLREKIITQARADFEAHYTFAAFSSRLRASLESIFACEPLKFGK